MDFAIILKQRKMLAGSCTVLHLPNRGHRSHCVRDHFCLESLFTVFTLYFFFVDLWMFAHLCCVSVVVVVMLLKIENLILSFESSLNANLRGKYSKFGSISTSQLTSRTH